MIKRLSGIECGSRVNDVFVLLGRDVAAPSTIRFWAFERLRLGKNYREDPQIVQALELADLIEKRQRVGRARS